MNIAINLVSIASHEHVASIFLFFRSLLSGYVGFFQLSTVGCASQLYLTVGEQGHAFMTFGGIFYNVCMDKLI